MTKPLDLNSPPTALLHLSESGQWLAFYQPREILVAEHLDQVSQICDRAGAAAEAGNWVVGFLTYEASPAFDTDLKTHASAGEPYAWWAIFDQAHTVEIDSALEKAEPHGLKWQPKITETAHAEAVAAIKSAIAQGDTYQVNLTFPLEATFSGDPLQLFLSLVRAQWPPYAAFIEAGRFSVCSASPELFFERRGRRIVTRPMKGTARRGRFLAEDHAAMENLRASPKERAENVMIVDMMRNDLGRIAQPGSVHVPELFTVETYATLHQLTSIVEATTDANLGAILAALFPCASITGAPKASTMGIIHHLEQQPRGIYTGAIGLLKPGGDARFSVAIRTVTVDKKNSCVRYGTGGGITWDSIPKSEFEECRTKALILENSCPLFDLIETFLWRPSTGYFLLEYHLRRLGESAQYFGRPFEQEDIREALAAAAAGFATEPQGTPRRVRLSLSPRGEIQIESTVLTRGTRTSWTLALDDRPVDERDPFLFHKTTQRRRYEEAKERRPEVDEILLWNRNHELTEGCRTNLVLAIAGRMLTPKRSCGLLAGTFRAALLARGRIEEAVLTQADLARADSLYLVNSVRGILPARWVGPERGGG